MVAASTAPLRRPSVTLETASSVRIGLPALPDRATSHTAKLARASLAPCGAVSY